MTRIKSVPVFRTARVFGLLHLMLGGVAACLGLIGVGIWSTESPIVTLTALLGLPILAGVCGFVGAALACWMYNQMVSWGDAFVLEVEEEATSAQGVQEQAENFYLPPAEEPQTETPAGNNEPAERRTLSVYRIGPEPRGRGLGMRSAVGSGRYRAEWIDVRNHGSASVRTAGLSLCGVSPSAFGETPKFRWVVNLPDCALNPSEILRMHSGQQRTLSLLTTEERTGAQWHSFTSQDAFVWDDSGPSSIALYDPAMRRTIDSVLCDPSLLAGVVLERQGERMAAAVAV